MDRTTDPLTGKNNSFMRIERFIWRSALSAHGNDASPEYEQEIVKQHR